MDWKFWSELLFTRFEKSHDFWCCFLYVSRERKKEGEKDQKNFRNPWKTEEKYSKWHVRVQFSLPFEESRTVTSFGYSSILRTTHLVFLLYYFYFFSFSQIRNVEYEAKLEKLESMRSSSYRKILKIFWRWSLFVHPFFSHTLSSFFLSSLSLSFISLSLWLLLFQDSKMRGLM